jgi:hypothetical protein
MTQLFPFGRMSTPRAPRHRRARPTLDILEDRLTPSVTVTTSLDPTTPIAGQLSLREAIDLVNAGQVADNTVILPAGAYLNLQGTLSVTHALTLQGAGAGATTVNGNGAGRVVFVHPATAVTVQLSGVTVRGGATGGFGGGIDVEDVPGQSSALALADCVVVGNRAAAGGGGINNSAGSVTLTGCQVLENVSALGNGGGVLLGAAGAGGLTAIGSTITGNSSSQGNGGGIAILSAGPVTLRGCTLGNNFAGLAGGGLDDSGNGTVTLTGCTVSRNQSNGGTGGGGVDYTGAASVRVANSVFSGNIANNALATGGGGGLEVNNAAATATVVDSLFSGNQADAAGGGVDVFSGTTLTVTGSTFVGNRTRVNFGGGLNLVTTGTNAAGTASSLVDDTIVGNYTDLLVGGGVELFGGDFNLTSDTITGNLAGGGGGGVNVNSGTAFFLDTIDAGNVSLMGAGAGEDVAVSLFGNLTSRGGNVIGDGNSLNGVALFPAGTPNANGDLAGTTANPLNPLLGPLQNNGGRLAGTPADQQVVPTEALLAGSPAIGKGVAGAPATDQRGFIRPPGRIDSGAFAFQALASRTALTSSANPALFGQPVVFTATVSSAVPGAGTPGGSVTFSIDGVPQPPVALVNGVASITLPSLPPGQHTVTAAYGGDVTFAASRTSLSETVQGLRDVTGLVKLTRVVLPGKHGKKGKFNPLAQTIQVTNVSGAPITGPVYLVLDRLTKGVTLKNAAGVSQTHVTPGDPFVVATMTDLGAGQSVLVTLLFTTTSKKPQVQFDTFVLAGPGVV